MPVRPRRSDVLSLAVLGLLGEVPLHGYALRKRLAGVLGPFRAFSYGTLYPCLRGLLEHGWISQREEVPAPGRRARIVYQLTPEGERHLARALADAGPGAWGDEDFDVRFALFARTDAAARLRILEGRRARMEERLAAVQESIDRNRERLDRYTLELQRHGLESVEREVRWLEELIDTERGRPPCPPPDHHRPDHHRPNHHPQDHLEERA